MKLTKMSKEEFLNLWPIYEVTPRVVTSATKSGYKHVHNPAGHSKAGKVSPATYRRNHMGRTSQRWVRKLATKPN